MAPLDLKKPWSPLDPMLPLPLSVSVYVYLCHFVFRYATLVKDNLTARLFYINDILKSRT